MPTIFLPPKEVISIKSQSWKETLELFKDKLEKEDKSKVPITNYCHDLSLFQRWYLTSLEKSEIIIEELKDTDFLAYKSFLQTVKRQRPATINRRIATLRSFCYFLKDCGFIEHFLTEHLKPLEVQSVRAPEILTHSQVLRLMGAVNKNTQKGRRDFAIIQLFVQAGLRLSELASIQLNDIEISERKGGLRIPSGKGQKPREVMLNKTARIALCEYLRVRPETTFSNYLFISNKRNPLAPRTIYGMVKGYLRKIGCGEYSCHSLRHLFATRLYNQGKDIVLVKEALGHKSIETTLRYSRKSKAEILEALESSELNIYR